MSESLVKSSESFQLVRAQKENYIFGQLEAVSVKDAIENFLSSLESHNTRKNYASHLRSLAKIININISLQEFSLLDTNRILDEVKQFSSLSEATKQARCACLISFTKFLSRRTEGIIKRAVPETSGVNRTFRKIRDKCTTNALNKTQVKRFLSELAKINKRDALIAKLILQGGKRKSEVLTADISNINWKTREITYRQSKTKGTEESTVITYSKEIMAELREYLVNRTKGPIFITSTGRIISATQIDRTFATAGKRAKIKFSVSPHVLRATAVTMMAKNFAPHEIMKVTGHKTLTQVQAYDKTSLKDNPSKKISLC